MGEPSRYKVSDDDAGVEGGILINKLGIKNQRDLDDAETLLVADSYKHFFEELAQGKITFDLSLLFVIHAYCFETLYAWAGKVRTIDLSKDGVLFASAQFLPATIGELRNIVTDNFPRGSDSKRTIAEKLALIHNEINIVHPFREGNGRTLRLFIDLIVNSLDLPAVNWDVPNYLDECKKGITGDNSGIEKIIHDSI